MTGTRAPRRSTKVSARSVEAYIAAHDRLVSKLPRDEQVLLRLKAAHLSYATIVQHVGVSAAAARKRVQRAVTKLRDMEKRDLCLVAALAALFTRAKHPTSAHGGALGPVAKVLASVAVTVGASATVAVLPGLAQNPALSPPPSVATTTLPAAVTARPAGVRPRQGTPADGGSSSFARTPSTSAVLPLPHIPARGRLHLSPNPRGGTQEDHAVSVDTAIGTLSVEGHRRATGASSVSFTCTAHDAVSCPEPGLSAEVSDGVESPAVSR